MSVEPEHEIEVKASSVIHSTTGRDFGRCTVCWYPVMRNRSYEDVRRSGGERETPWRHQPQRVRVPS